MEEFCKNCLFLRWFQCLHKEQCDDVLLFFKWSNKCLWNRPLRLSCDACNRIKIWNFKNWNLKLWLAVIINTLIMKSFDQKMVPQKNIWNALKETIFTYLTNMLLLEKVCPCYWGSLMTKKLHKAIMKRSWLRNKFLKTKSIMDRKSYNFQQSYCKKLY